MYGHKRDLALVGIVGVVLVGQQHDALQPLVDGGRLERLAVAGAYLGVALLGEGLHRVEQLLDIVYGRGDSGVFSARRAVSMPEREATSMPKS